MMKSIGFFDVDCRELSPGGDALVFRPRVRPIADQLMKLYGFAERNNMTLVFTTCCSGNMLRDDSKGDILFVPLDREKDDWKDKVDDYRLFYLQKKAYGDPKVNFACRAHEVFSNNGNALDLLEKLGVGHWIVFGNGLDMCVDNVVDSILNAGYKVTFLSDVMISSATGYGAFGTEENKVASFERWRTKGAVEQTLNEFLDGCNKKIFGKADERE